MPEQCERAQLPCIGDVRARRQKMRCSQRIEHSDSGFGVVEIVAKIDFHNFQRFGIVQCGKELFMKYISQRFVCVLPVLALGFVSARADNPAAPKPIPVQPVPPAVAPGVVPQGPSPKITFETPSFDFGRARAGDPVKHTFIFTNTGEATLEISAVRPGCGCTTAGEWTRKVEPGKTGTIPIQVNVAATWPAGPIIKVVTVDSNDRSQPSIQLQVKGNVWKPIDINPGYAILNIPADLPSASTVIRITSNLEEPVKLENPVCSNPVYSLALKETKPGKEFELTVTAHAPITNGQGQITIKTSSTNSPEVTLTAWANVQPAIAVIPPVLTLPQAPLATKATPTVTIQNNGTNTLKLSDATITGMPGLENVPVTIEEPTPGKLFAVKVAFPEGFTIPAGQHLELSFKSTHPQHPVIRVPVNQIPGPARPIAPLKPATPTTSSAIPLPPPVHAATAATAAK
jgi:hypothetical protein